MEKNAELDPNDALRKYKGRAVYLGEQVKDEDFNWATFAELGSNPPSMEAGKMLDALGCLEGYSNPLLDDKKRLEIDYQFGTMIDKAAEKRGLLVRPIINMCVFSPPLIITKKEIDLMFNILDDAVSEVEKKLK